jgi:cysteine desulfurase
MASTTASHPAVTGDLVVDADGRGAGVPPGLLSDRVYLDYNATTPVDTRVVEAVVSSLLTDFGNPSSTHAYGLAAARALARAREQVARLIGVSAGGLTFTGSGTEADALAIRGVVAAAVDAGARAPHVIIQTTEHPAVLAACRSVVAHGVRLTVLPVDDFGRVSTDDLSEAVDDETVLVSIMHSNNETGTLQPIAELARIAHEAGALFHTDAAQTVGKVPLDATSVGVDLLTLVGHKVYAPKGIAALYVRDGVPIAPLVGGGGQERGMRAGTENVAYAVALGVAADLAGADLANGAPERLAALRDTLHQRLEDALPGRVHLNGDPERRLPNTLNVSIDGIQSREVLDSCVQVAASAGSACHAGQEQPSPVLTAMGMPPARALSALRLTLGRWTTTADLDRASEELVRAVLARRR